MKELTQPGEPGRRLLGEDEAAVSDAGQDTCQVQAVASLPACFALTAAGLNSHDVHSMLIGSIVFLTGCAY